MGFLEELKANDKKGYFVVMIIQLAFLLVSMHWIMLMDITRL